MDKNWICHKSCEQGNNYLIYFRKEFNTENNQEIVIKIHANQTYKIYLNGEFMFRGMAASCVKYPFYNHHKYRCNADRTCVAVLLYGMGENIPLVTEQNQGPISLNMEVSIGSQKFISDASWKCRPAPEFFRDTMSSLDPMANRISAWGGYKEIYDTRLREPLWMAVGFDDSEWQNAEICEKANAFFGDLIEYDLPPLAESESEPPVLIQTDDNLGSITVKNGEAVLDAGAPGAFPAAIYDFKKEVVGYPRLRVQGERGSSLSVWYGESLDLLRTDTFILDGTEQVLEPFQRRACRYLKVSVNGGSVPTVIKKIHFTLTHFPLSEKEKLIFDNDLLQKVYETSLYTTMLASQYHFEDSVYREQMQWLLDSRIMALVHYECFGEYRLAEKAIRQFCRTQRDDGSICAAGPQECSQLLPDFCLHFVMMAEEYVRYSKRKADAEMLAPLDKLFAWLKNNEDEEGLLDIDGKDGWWCFIDWAPIDKRGKVTALNCLYYQALMSFANILEKDSLKSEFYFDKACKLRKNINRQMFDTHRRMYCDCVQDGVKSSSYSQQTNMYALICNVADDSDTLLKKTTAADFPGVKINGAFMMCLTVDYLLDKGYVNIAQKWIDDYWGEMLRRGATSWWETFDMSTPRVSVPYAYSKNNATYMHEYIPVSYCHAWGAGIAYSLAKAKRVNKI